MIEKKWITEPLRHGMYWVYHLATKHIGTASVLEREGRLVVCLNGLEALFAVADLRGRILFYPADVPPPPEELQLCRKNTENH